MANNDKWWNFFRLFKYAFTDDPVSRKDRKEGDGGAGFSSPEGMPDIRSNSDGMGGGGSVRLRDTTEMVDLSTVTNRIHRYKEYDRLRSMAEIDMAMTVIADEACVSGDTLVATPSMDGGMTTIKKLAETMKDEKFLVYCYDFEKEDYTLGWAYDPRLVKVEETVKIVFDDGNHLVATKDHKVLLRNSKWINAGDLKYGDEVMPFYHIPARPDLTGQKTKQWPRIFTFSQGWMNERQFVDEWKGKINQELREVCHVGRMISEGLGVRQISEITGHEPKVNQNKIERAGFSNRELKWLGKKADRRRVVGVLPHDKIEVYDMTVDKHHNFATNWGIVHNCQRDDDGRVFKINIKNQEIKDELEFLWFNRKMLNWDQKRCWNRFKNLAIHGDDFWEVVINPENPKEGVLQIVPLPPELMYRIETTKGRLIEFQQAKEGPDYQSLERVEVTQATEADLQQAKAIRFAAQQIVHVRIGDDRKTFYPYGVSLMEAARGPAHQLRMMEDAMIVYRLTRAPERRVFYVDVQSMTNARAEAFIERMKDQFKKKKMSTGRGEGGASSVEERWHAPAADEDFWIATRPNSNTRVETLPGAQNLGEIDDTVYFRNKLFVALNFPKNYHNNEDPQTTRIALSAQDIKFARMIERLQSHMEDAIWEVCDRHLKLRGYPEEMYEDLMIQMTPPSDWRELTRGEVLTARITNAGSLKGAQIMADYDILTEYMHYPEDVVKKMLARLKDQKLEELKLQVIAQNPSLLGIGNPGTDEQQIGSEAGQNPPMLGGDPNQPPPPGGADPMGGAPVPAPAGPAPQGGGSIIALPEPSDEELRKFNLDIKDYGSEQDEEETDSSEF
jgi:hypothetical protein